MAAPDEPYAPSRHVEGVDGCTFYHTMDLPGHGVVEGQWDLRGRIDDYTGDVDVAGKRVLEVGTASGFLCFALEDRGAEVVAYDLSEHQPWDLVPFAGLDLVAADAERRKIMRRINDGYWLGHRIFESRAKVVYGTVYEIPDAIGPVDVATYCSMLLHVRDPFAALARGLRLTRETAVVTDVLVAGCQGPERPDRAGGGPSDGLRPPMRFFPNARDGGPIDTWWSLSPEIIETFLGVLGFGDTTVTLHRQLGQFGECDFFTVVGRRTSGEVVSGGD